MINNNQTIPCPVCQTPIPFDTKQLLSGVSFTCPNSSCDAAISLSQESKPIVSDTIEKLESLKDHITHKKD